MTAATKIVTRGRGHSYLLDGEKVPGVTTVLNQGIPKPFLVGWAARTTAEYVIDRLEVDDGRVVADQLVAGLHQLNAGRKTPEPADGQLPRVALSKLLAGVPYADRDQAANRGTEVHNLAERLARGEEIEVPDAVAGHVDAYLQFLDDWSPTNAILERVVVNRKWGYMGKFDMIADFAGLGRGLVDIKTTRSAPYAEVALQLAAYRYAETMLGPSGDGDEEPMPQVDWCGVVWVRADGYDVFRFEADQSAFRTFLYAKHVGDWLDRDTGAAASVRSEALVPPARAEVAS